MWDIQVKMSNQMLNRKDWNTKDRCKPEMYMEETVSYGLYLRHGRDEISQTMCQVQFSSVAQSCPTLSDFMNRSTPGLPVHHHLPEFTQTCPSSRWCHLAILSSVVPFSSYPQSLPASESFPMSQLFIWGGQSTGVSALASVLPKNTQGWSPLEWTGWISLSPANETVQWALPSSAPFCRIRVAALHAHGTPCEWACFLFIYIRVSNVYEQRRCFHDASDFLGTWELL